MNRVAVLVCVAVCAFGDYVTLKSGEKYIGDIVKNDPQVVVIETVDGLVTVHHDLVARVTKAVSVVGLYKQKRAAAHTAAAHYELAQWCYASGYTVAGDRELGEALRIDPQIACEDRRQTAPQAGPEDKAAVHTQAERAIALRRTLSSVRNLYGTERAAKHISKLEQYSAEEKAPVLVRQLNYTSKRYAGYRRFLIDQLAAMDCIVPEQYLAHMLKEPSGRVREHLYSVLARNPNTLIATEDRMLAALSNTCSSLRSRVNAAETLGRMRSARGVSVLVQRLKMIWGQSARAHFFAATRHAYIRDVTPVVAEGATSFDPEVDYYTTGVVLDAKIMTVERDVIIRALQTTTNLYIERTEDWLQWWQDKGKREYAEKPAE